MKSVVDISSRQTKAQCNHKGFEMTKDSIERLAQQQQQHTHLNRNGLISHFMGLLCT